MPLQLPSQAPASLPGCLMPVAARCRTPLPCSGSPPHRISPAARPAAGTLLLPSRARLQATQPRDNYLSSYPAVQLYSATRCDTGVQCAQCEPLHNPRIVWQRIPARTVLESWRPVRRAWRQGAAGRCRGGRETFDTRRRKRGGEPLSASHLASVLANPQRPGVARPGARRLHTGARQYDPGGRLRGVDA